MIETPLWARVYEVDAAGMMPDLCNLWFDEDSVRYKTLCKCYRCDPYKKSEKPLFGELR